MSGLTRDFFQKIQKWEGGYQDMSSDTGNYNACGKLVGTNRGITSKTIETLMGVKCPDKIFMQGITEDYAFEVLTKFWDFYRVDEILDQDIANLVFNNFMGLPKKAAETVQLACNRFQANLKVDGAMGSKTITALNSLAAQNRGAIYNAILEEWLKYLNTTQLVFRQGLLSRVNDLFFFITAAANAPVPVAETNNLLRVQTILQGASKGKTEDVIAFVVGLLAIVFISFSAYRLLIKK
jgi:lysozyme family protein